MLSYLLLLSFLNIVFTYDIPTCVSCKWFIASKSGNPDLGLCRMFKENYNFNDNIIHYNFVNHCRNDEKLCGKNGFLYEPLDENTTEVEAKPKTTPKPEILTDYDELNNRCCGEVNETDEIEQLERDFFELFQKIKKHNKKIVFNASKDLYQFFRKID